jgi:UDP-N-acetylglucosamine 1-carboxyvinyltransferase
MSEQAFRIRGGQPLKGEIKAQRAKNAVLPMIAAALVPREGKTVLYDVPEIADVLLALELAQICGADVQHDREAKTVVIDASGVQNGELPSHITERFRGSVLFLAPLIARLGYVRLPGSGGCDIGTRKIDFHHRGFARLGADVRYDADGTTIIDAGGRPLQGTMLYLDLPSHTGTENLMLGAATAQGTTIIENAAVEPEVVDFGQFLIKMGAKIEGLGTPTLMIEGVETLNAIEYRPMPDRLVIGLIMMCVAATGGDVTITDAEPKRLRLVTAKLEQMGVEVKTTDDSIRIVRDMSKRLTPINITTHPYPGYPTDLQPCISALSTVAQGKSFIRERIFENRYDFIEGLLAMGADILITQHDVCVVNGVEALKPARVRAASIRAGAALLLAAVAAKGETIIDNIYQIDRGHEHIEAVLRQIGVDIVRIELTEEENAPVLS